MAEIRYRKKNSKKLSSKKVVRGTDGQTDRRTDGRTDGRTDKARAIACFPKGKCAKKVLTRGVSYWPRTCKSEAQMSFILCWSCFKDINYIGKTLYGFYFF